MTLFCCDIKKYHNACISRRSDGRESLVTRVSLRKKRSFSLKHLQFILNSSSIQRCRKLMTWLYKDLCSALIGCFAILNFCAKIINNQWRTLNVTRKMLRKSLRLTHNPYWESNRRVPFVSSVSQKQFVCMKNVINKNNKNNKQK